MINIHLCEQKCGIYSHNDLYYMFIAHCLGLFIRIKSIFMHHRGAYKKKHDGSFCSEFLDILNITIFFAALSWMMFIRNSSVHKCSEVGTIGDDDYQVLSVKDHC